MNSKYIIFFVGFIALIGLIFFAVNSSKKAKYNWQTQFRIEDKDVYGLSITKNIIKALPNRELKEVDSRLGAYFEESTATGTNDNYFFIGPALFLDSLDVKAILEFVGAGNKAFISSLSIPDNLMEELHESCLEDWYWYDYEYFYEDTAYLQLNHLDLKTNWSTDVFKMKRDSGLVFKDWSYISDSLICQDEGALIPLGKYDNDKINFVKRHYKNGVFYLHTTPLAFANLHLLKDENVAYLNAVYAHLNTGDVIWDDFNRISLSAGRRMNNRTSISSDGPLKYILQQPAFAWAWYILLALGLLYLVFRGKRSQRVIPVIEKNKNSSLEFIGTIGTMYFMQNDHKKLCLEQMSLFLSDVRENYRVNTNVVDESFVNKLAQKTGVPKALITKIIKYNTNISHSDFVSENTMIEFYQLINQFTKTASTKNYAV